jgi:hypothetical protein
MVALYKPAVGAFLILLLTATAHTQQASPTSESTESVEIGGMTLRLGMLQDRVIQGLQRDYTLLGIATPPAGGTSWTVATKTGPPYVAVATVTFVGGELSSVSKYWDDASDSGTSVNFASTLYGAIAKFEQNNSEPCQVAASRSPRPGGEVRTVLVTCRGRQKYLSVDILPAENGKEKVSLAEVLKYPSDDIQLSKEIGGTEILEMPEPSSPEPEAETAPALAPDQPGSAEIPAAKALAAPHIGRTKADRWYPHDVDQSMPSVAPGTACPLATVLSKAGRRIEELVDNVNKFTATEIIEHQGVDKTGQLRSPQIRKFNYLVSIAKMPSGYLNVDEYRDGGSDPGQFPDQIATVGTPSLVLIFHPQHARNFNMTCEGLGQWEDKAAWLVRFEERKDSRHRMSVVAFSGRSFSLRLRGRAWILADSYQVARLESDLAEEIPQIRLRLQHQDIQYRPVHFAHGGEIWLPSSSEFYMDFRNHRFYRRHRFTEFQLFGVKIQQTVGDPKEE